MASQRSLSISVQKGAFKRRTLALTITAALSSTAFYADAATTAKDDTINVTASSAGDAAQESAWGPSATIAAKHSATGTKTDTPLVKTPQSVSVVTREEMDMKQPVTVKEALGYTPGVFASRGSSNTIDAMAIRGFTSVNTNQYLDGIKLQGDNYSEVSMDTYMLERDEVLRGSSPVLYGKSNPGGLGSIVRKRQSIESPKEVQT